MDLQCLATLRLFLGRSHSMFQKQPQQRKPYSSTASLALVVMLLHSPDLADGKGSALLRKIRQHSLVPSTMPSCTMWEIRSLGTKETASTFSRGILRSLASIISYLLAPPGEVSRSCCVSYAFEPLTSAGPGYRSDKVFNLKEMQPYNLTEILDSFRKLTRDVVIYLPRTSDLRQLASQRASDRKTTVIHYCMEGASKVH